MVIAKTDEDCRCPPATHHVTRPPRQLGELRQLHLLEPSSPAPTDRTTRAPGTGARKTQPPPASTPALHSRRGPWHMDQTPSSLTTEKDCEVAQGYAQGATDPASDSASPEPNQQTSKRVMSPARGNGWIYAGDATRENGFPNKRCHPRAATDEHHPRAHHGAGVTNQVAPPTSDNSSKNLTSSFPTVKLFPIKWCHQRVVTWPLGCQHYGGCTPVSNQVVSPASGDLIGQGYTPTGILEFPIKWCHQRVVT